MTTGRYEENANGSAREDRSGENRTQLARELAAFTRQIRGHGPADWEYQFLRQWLERYSAGDIRAALREAVSKGARSEFRYADCILRNPGNSLKIGAYRYQNCNQDRLHNAPGSRDCSRAQDSGRRRADTDEYGRYLSGPFSGMTHREVILSLYEN